MEKTSPPHTRQRSSGKHLHGRGEDDWDGSVKLWEWETPPRTWRRLTGTIRVFASLGNTSTDVEKTVSAQNFGFFEQKHLHGRGEDTFVRITEPTLMETPPRTWRRLNEFHHEPGRRWKHLHGRGEDGMMTSRMQLFLETPPRTWRRRTGRRSSVWRSRNTSTDVEKTRAAIPTADVKGKHLHGRGEDSWFILLNKTNKETPPRTWRRRVLNILAVVVAGNTSTDVEKTFAQSV